MGASPTQTPAATRHTNTANGAAGAQDNGATDNGHGYPDAQTGAIWRGELSKTHRAQLENESKISSDAIEARGYFTADDANLLKLHGYAKAQALIPALVIPLWDFRGNRAGVAIRHTVARHDSATGKKIKYDLPKGAAPTLDVSPLTRDLIADVTKPLLITEGAKKADSAASRGLCAINLNGVWGFKSKDAALPDWQEIPLRGRVVFIAYDSDINEKWGVEAATRRLHALLVSLGAVVKVIYLPDGPKDGRTGKAAKTGLDDYFAQGGTVEQLFMLARDLDSLEESKRKRREREKAEKRAEIEAKAAAAGVPVIETNGRQHPEKLRDLGDAISQLNTTSPRIFRGFSGLVEISHDATGAARLKGSTRASLQCLAGDAAEWIRTGEREGVVCIDPPRDLCENYMAREENWRGVPFIDGTATAPFFAPDGTLCDRTGFYPEARAWLSLPKGFDVGDTAPTRANIEAARRLILETVLQGVAFADAASRAHAVALMLLPFVRRMIDDATPLHLFNAPLRGSGKTYAAELCVLPFATPTLTPEKSTDEEWRKSLFCELATGPSHILLDNIKRNLNSSTLDAAITARSGFLRERLTGTGEMVTASTRCVWVATANNAELTPDAATRSVVIQLDTNSENPDLREFKSDPVAFVQANRAQVIGALLTLVRAWQAEQCPHYRGSNRIRFNTWARVMGGILDVVEIPGFLDNVREQRENIGAVAGSEWHELTALWFEKHGAEPVTAKELLPIAENISDMAAAMGKAEGAAREKSLAALIAKRRDQLFSGLKIKKGPLIKRKVTFKVEKQPEMTYIADLADLSIIPRETVKNLEDLENKHNKIENKDGFAHIRERSAKSAMYVISPEIDGEAADSKPNGVAPTEPNPGAANDSDRETGEI
jgi:hypothetical protein